MALFNYVGVDISGQKTKGKIEADSLEGVVNKLRFQNINILDIFEVKKGSNKVKLNSKDLELFTRQLSSLISSRIPIIKSLDILTKQTEKKVFREIISSIQKSIKAGNSLADSFSRYPKVFSNLFVNMVNVGEFSGNLDAMLERLADHIEGYNALVKKVKAAMMYPMGIMGVAGFVLLIIFIFVIPGFEKIFESMGGKLPLPTQLLINASEGLRRYFLYIFGFIGLIIFLIKRYFLTPKGELVQEKIRRKIPVMGALYSKMVLARFTKTLATLVKSGVSILNALEIAGKTSGSYQLEAIVRKAKEDVAGGQKLAEALSLSGFFPLMAVNMIGVGEEGGDLGGMLEKISELYNKDVDTLTSGLLSLLEPAIIVIMGVIIGGIVISLFLPIMKMHELMR